MTSPTSELAWLLADYQANNVEPPARVTSHPDRTEGQMMSDTELEEFITDSIATLRILQDHNSTRYAQVYDSYLADLAYLAEIGRLTEDDYADLTSHDNLHF